MLKSNFKIFLILILIFNLFTTTSLAATTKEAYNQEELMQYPGYGKAMYETIVDETTFITGQYTDNKEFVNKSIDQIRDYGKFWWNEQNWESEAWTYDRFKEMVAKPTGYFLTVGDWVKKFFTGYGEEYHPPEPSVNEIYDFTDYIRSVQVVSFVPTASTVSAYVTFKLDVSKRFELKGKSSSLGAYKTFVFDPMYSENYWVMHIGGSSKETSQNNVYHPTVEISSVGREASGNNMALAKRAVFYVGPTVKYPDFSATKVGYEHLKGVIYPEYISKSSNVNDVMNLIISQVNSAVENDFTASAPLYTPEVKPNDFEKFKEQVDTKVSKMATPQPRPYLSCPNGTKIEMSISGSTFLGVDGKAMIVNKDGTAQVDSAICNLGWDKPEVKYLEGRPAIQTPDKGWQDVETGELIIPGENGGMQCVENGVVVPCNDIEKPDGSLLAYVKNAYEYATSLIDTAVNGLKQLSSGAVGMIELYKIYMSWLPTEIQTVMYSGLAIMIGLRVFRK